MQNTQNVDKIDLLKASPLFAMSLGSRELFHSNFWYWLIDNDRKLAKVFFSDIEWKAIEDTRRESKNRDISIHLKDGSVYVIENKIKSIPSNGQLEKYTINTSKFKQGILTGIKETLVIKDADNWTFLSYRDIAKRIMLHARSSNASVIRVHQTLIEKYCAMLFDLSEVVDRHLENTEGLLNYDTGRLSEIRFDDVYKKFKAEDFMTRYIRNSDALREITPRGYKMEYHTSYTNKQALIDIRFLIKDVLSFGVQVQGSQFRIFAQREIANSCEDVFKEFTGYGWFDSTYDRYENRSVFGEKTLMKPRNSKQYNKYETNRYSFVYQYFTLEETTDYETLYQLIMDYLKKARATVAPNVARD